jgi:NAD(P)-dependent dehydrogenase (short-subunit alcohol dehydrogenase family)
MFSLKGKSAFITGGTSGIGLAVAKRFLAAGAAVAVSDITDGTRVAEEIGAALMPYAPVISTRPCRVMQRATPWPKP